MTTKQLSEELYTIPTQLIYGKSAAKEWDYGYHVVPPIAATTTFRLGSTERGACGFQQIGKAVEEGESPIYVYDRMGNPNNDMLQHALAIAEGGDGAIVFASGMAAVHAAALAFVEAGQEIICHSAIYGGSYALFNKWFKRFGIKILFADFTNLDQIRSLITQQTRLFYLESPVNPSLQLLDIDAIAALIKQVNATRSEATQILSAIDNTFATPWGQRPLAHGIDLVVHSLTKGISGFGTTFGGAVVTRKEFLERLIHFRKDFGATMIPHSAWNILTYGLSTLSMRMPRQQKTAWAIAEYLAQHPKVQSVNYPGLESFPQYELAKRLLKDYEGNFAPGFMIYFVLKGDNPDAARQRGHNMMNFIADNSYTITLAVSLGQLRTLIEHPGSTTHSAYSSAEQIAAGVDPSGIRLSVGIENSKDIIYDLERALAQV